VDVHRDRVVLDRIGNGSVPRALDAARYRGSHSGARVAGHIDAQRWEALITARIAVMSTLREHVAVLTQTVTGRNSVPIRMEPSRDRCERVCGGSPASPTAPLTGVWGRDHISLTATSSGNQRSSTCAHGDTVLPLALTPVNVFTVSGTFVARTWRSYPGGCSAGRLPCGLLGLVIASTMVLTVVLTDTPEVIGTFTLMKDTPGAC